MKPDPDMMSQAMHESARTLKAIAQFNVRSGLHFGSDADHAVAHADVRELADELQKAGDALHRIAIDADKRLTSASQISTKQ